MENINELNYLLLVNYTVNKINIPKKTEESGKSIFQPPANKVR